MSRTKARWAGWMSIKRKEDRVRNRAIIKFLGRMSLLSLLVIVLVLAGCGEKETAAPPLAPAPTPAPATTAPVKSIIDVFQKTSKIASLSFSDLQGLPQTSVETTAGVQEGPTLEAVLEQAGVQEFSKVVIFGLTKERTMAAVLPLSRAKVTEQVILNLTDQGTAELVSPDIAKDKWVFDVSRLTVD
jgi:hypothetical protein